MFSICASLKVFLGNTDTIIVIPSSSFVTFQNNNIVDWDSDMGYNSGTDTWQCIWLFYAGNIALRDHYGDIKESGYCSKLLSLGGQTLALLHLLREMAT